eukprot:GHVS01038952.1.p1 GENE.GHVS01038952.1~~GHVS01038952.1.p1  ORF type:complete len:166 (+),score=30.28 GHVS01038952.1:32-499(+)
MAAEDFVKLKFRNYVPRDPALRKHCLPRPSVEELEKRIDKEAAEAIQKATDEDVLSQINPKRPNWDLKRDVQRRLAVLSHRTDKAIVQLIRKQISESEAAKELQQSISSEVIDVEHSEERLTTQQRELAQSIVNAMDDMDKSDDEETDIEESNLG